MLQERTLSAFALTEGLSRGITRLDSLVIFCLVNVLDSTGLATQVWQYFAASAAYTRLFLHV